MPDQPSSLKRARAAKPKVQRAFQRIGSVNGVGLTRKNGAYAVKVNLESPLDRNVDYPKSIDGVAVVVKVLGKIRKQGIGKTKSAPVARARAAKVG